MYQAEIVARAHISIEADSLEEAEAIIAEKMAEGDIPSWIFDAKNMEVTGLYFAPGVDWHIYKKHVFKED